MGGIENIGGAGLAIVVAVAACVVWQYRHARRLASRLRVARAEADAANRRLEECTKALETIARTDSLTGLANRHRLSEALHEEMLRLRRYGTEVSVILLDIDHFRRINDLHGHQAGDRVLVHLANILASLSRATDMVSRWGGEEFLVLCPHTPLVGARRLADALRAAVEDSSDGFATPYTASFGVAAVIAEDTEDSLLARVAGALQEAKADDRNCVVSAPAPRAQAPG